MPFTVSHIAAAIPLRRLLGRWTDLRALAIGTMAPDLSYFTPFHLPRIHSHGIPSIVYGSLPLGLVVYAIHRRLLEEPVIALLPRAVRCRIGPIPRWDGFRLDARLAAACISLLAGAASHVLWDSFTHFDGPAVEAFGLFRLAAFTVAGHPIPVYKLLQHGSTLAGMAILAWTIRRWTEGRPIQTDSDNWPLRVSRFRMAGILLAGPVVGGFLAALAIDDPPGPFGILQSLAGRTVFSALPLFALLLSVYCFIWRVSSPSPPEQRLSP